MANDLEKFLQQAAERLAQKLQQKQNPPPRQPQSPPKVVRPQTTRAAADSGSYDEIVDAAIVESSPDYNPRELGPDRLSSIDTRPGLAQVIGQTDERMAGRLHEVFDHEVMHLRKASSALKSNSQDSMTQGETEKSIDLQRRQHSVSGMVELLRSPKTLSAAFVASEIFKRKF